jgi:hypothetical protein
MEPNTSDLIKRYNREVKEHHQEAVYEIWAYYHKPEVTEYDYSPHDQQFLQAAAYIDMAITKVGEPGEEWKDQNLSKSWLSRRDWSRHMAADLQYGVALELIVSAVHLKLKTQDYIRYMVDHNGNTPYIDDSKDCLEEDLESDVTKETVEEINATLKLAKDKRNNLAHFGHHYMGGPNYSDLFVTVAGYLIDRYTDTDEIPELQRMADYLNLLDEQRVDGEIYPDLSIDFRPVT